MDKIFGRHIHWTAAPTAKDTTPTMTLSNLPSNILEAFIPGYSLISRFILDVFGFDVSLVVSVSLLLVGCVTALTYLYRKLGAQILEHFTATVTIESDDDIFDHIVSWVSEHHVAKLTRSLRVKSVRGSSWDMDDEPIPERAGFDGLQNHFLFNFSNWEAKVPPRFEPHEMSKWFWHKGYIFRFRRDRYMVLGGGGPFGKTFQEDEQVTMTVLGRSTQPIKDLIIEARNLYLSKEKTRTTVRRPAPKEHRARGRQAWSKVATRPSRSIDTVVLDHSQKDKLLADINEYLHPATPKWYANRGIPYRRGYLFYGPPGTGKTSLSFAIAGAFGLDIYCISLLEPSLTEEDLGLLFSSLPRHCVVLLEDIDSAGLTREEDETNIIIQVKEGVNGGNNDNSKPATAETVGKQSRMRNMVNWNQDKQGISLSGLLNAIDGVASHEGRVLVMTTNHPEKLDAALIRPGRVDMKIEFTLATREQIRQLFLRMYSSDTKAEKGDGPSRFSTACGSEDLRLTDPSYMEKRHDNNEHSTTQNPHDAPSLSPAPYSMSVLQDGFGFGFETLNLNALASAFAAALPDSKFSPAEIQGFLLTRKKEPQQAVDEVEDWRDEVLSARKGNGSGVNTADAASSNVGTAVGHAKTSVEGLEGRNHTNYGREGNHVNKEVNGGCDTHAHE